MDRTQGPPPGQGTRPPLRLVRLLSPSESSAPRKRKRRGYIFTMAQEAWMRVALGNARASFGSWSCLSDAMGIGYGAVMGAVQGRNHISPEMVIRFAAATGLSVDGLLHSSIAAAGRCPTCGAVRGAS
jgi:hypothetical protein